METDDILARSLARDLDGSFETLVRGHADRIFTIALRFLGDRHDAEEAAQDAFVRAYRALARYEPERIAAIALRPWLATIVLNVCRTGRRRRTARGPAPLSLDSQSSTGESTEPAGDARLTPAATVDRREANARWAALLADLPPIYRAPVVPRHVDGMSYPDVAAALARPEGTVKAQVHRGLALLRAGYVTAERREHEELSA